LFSLLILCPWKRFGWSEKKESDLRREIEEKKRSGGERRGGVLTGGSRRDIASESAVREEDHTSSVTIIGATRDISMIIDEVGVITEKFRRTSHINTTTRKLRDVVCDSATFENERSLSCEKNSAAISGSVAVGDFNVGEV